MNNESSATNYRKLYNKHVHERFFLKKHMGKIDDEMRQKQREISDTQLSFVRKYKQLIVQKDGKTASRNNRRYSCGDISQIEIKNNKNKSTHETRDSRLKVPFDRRASIAVIRKNSFVEPPIDFPYSFTQWHERVDHGTFADDGLDPRDKRKDQFLKSLKKLPDVNNDNSNVEDINSLERTDTFANYVVKENQLTSRSSVSDVTTRTKSTVLTLPNIDERPRSYRCMLKDTKIQSDSLKRKVHFKTEHDTIDLNVIDKRMGQIPGRRKSFSDFRSNVLNTM
ncbi:unnamed protein product [Mytilus coruscus]|uniref:Uncharacterized protein n=1 Tax=Mytilus coruscus TaxID=42192 RepID=A0A6J8CFB0_MYTCO|nr:unnamed protein product [Mytilus coruscus]